MDPPRPSSSGGVDKYDFYYWLAIQIFALGDSLKGKLVEAVQGGDARRLKELVGSMNKKTRAKLGKMNIDRMGLLQLAVFLGKLEVCRYFVEELGFDVDCSGACKGATPLGCASLFGEVACARFLLDHGADPNKMDETAHVALHSATKNGNEEVVQLLLSRGARVDIATPHGTPLHIAVSYGKIGAAKILLEHHADPNSVSEVFGSPLAMALESTEHGLTESDSLECVKLLVKAGADVNSANPSTPLALATVNGLAGCIKYLLEAGGDPNVPNYQCGRRPIEIASSLGRRDLVEILFPFTCPIQTVSDWSVEGIIAHRKSKSSLPKVNTCNNIKGRKATLRLNGEKAVKRKDYLSALKLYSEALELDNSDATLYSNRSLCYLNIGDAQKALLDADSCINIRPKWVKGYYRKGAALMSLKEYKKALNACSDGLKIDPCNAEVEKVMWEALEAVNGVSKSQQ